MIWFGHVQPRPISGPVRISDRFIVNRVRVTRSRFTKIDESK